MLVTVVDAGETVTYVGTANLTTESLSDAKALPIWSITKYTVTGTVTDEQFTAIDGNRTDGNNFIWNDRASLTYL